VSNELDWHSEYRPIRRSNGGSGSSAVRRIMAIRSEAMIDRARIAAEVTNEQFQVHARMDAGFDLTMHMTSRSAQLASFIHDTGNDPELHQLHTYLKAACAEAIIDLIKGSD
jgi:hypothetical protein